MSVTDTEKALTGWPKCPRCDEWMKKGDRLPARYRFNWFYEPVITHWCWHPDSLAYQVTEPALPEVWFVMDGEHFDGEHFHAIDHQYPHRVDDCRLHHEVEEHLWDDQEEDNG